MESIDDSRLDEWTPDLSSSEQKNPSWTRVVWRNIVVCNSLEGVDWSESPTQVLVCEHCGYPGCETGGYARLTRLDGCLLWTRPRWTGNWPVAEFATSPTLRESGAFSLSVATWDRWRVRVPSLPVSTEFKNANGIELADAWLSTLPISARVRDLSDLLPMLRRDLLMGDATLSMIDRVQRIIGWLEKHRQIAAAGELLRAAQVDIEELYLDATREAWRGLARRHGQDAFVLGDLVFVPG